MDSSIAMSDVVVKPSASATPLILRYLLVLIAGSILVIAANIAMQAYFKAGLGAAMGLLVIWAAATSTGRAWFTREQARPPSGRLWSLALICALATFVFQSVLVALAYLGATLHDGRAPMLWGNSRDGMIIAGALVVVALLELLIIRLGLWLGAKEGQKWVERQAAKGKA